MRLEILIDGKVLFGVTLDQEKSPENHQEFCELLKELLDAMNAPSVKDDELF